MVTPTTLEGLCGGGGGDEEGPERLLQDQLRRLPKTAHTFTLGVLPVSAVSTGLLYIPLKP